MMEVIWLLLAAGLLLVEGRGFCDRQVAIDVLLNTDAYYSETNTTVAGWSLETVDESLPVDMLRLYQSDQLFRVPCGCGEGIQISGRLQFHNTLYVIFPPPFYPPLGYDQDPVYGYATIGFRDYSGWAFEIWLCNSKVYAFYARFPTTQSPTNFYRSFAFLVPIGDRQPANVDLYEVYLEPTTKSVSYRMNDFELLRIKPVGTSQVDSKFMLADYGGYWDIEATPEQLYAQFGTTRNIAFDGLPHPACQLTLFKQCLDNIFDSKKTVCQYSPLPLMVPPMHFFYGQTAVLVAKDVAVTAVRNLRTCPEWTCDPSYKKGNLLP